MTRNSTAVSKNQKICPGSAREQGNLWVPVNPILVDNDLFERKLAMNKGDKLVHQMENKIHRSSLKEDDVKNLISFTTLQETKRSRSSNFLADANHYQSRPRQSF